jgi:DUF971 family protein
MKGGPPDSISYSPSKRTLTLVFPNEAPKQLSAELLRVLSPSAEVQGHGPGQEVLQTGKLNVGITDIQPVGHYAVQLTFDDGHSSGLYTWAYLAHLVANKDRLWNEYLEKLADAGASRDPHTDIVRVIG